MKKAFVYTALFVVCLFVGFELYPPASVRDVRLEVVAATVRITTAHGQGSGLLFEDGIILTAAHLFIGEDNEPTKDPILVEVFTDPPALANAELLHIDAESDLALLASLLTSTIARATPWAEPVLLDQVYVAGCPLARRPMSMPGEILLLDDEIAGIPYHVDSAPMTFGTSGGPVFKIVRGRPVFLGVVSRMHTRSQNMQWFVPVSRVKAFFERSFGVGSISAM